MAWFSYDEGTRRVYIRLRRRCDVGADAFRGVQQGEVLRFHALDLESARAGIAGVYEATEIEVDRSSSFQLVSDALRLNRVTVGQLGCTHSARLTTAVENYHVLLPVLGTLEVVAGRAGLRKIGSSDAVVFAPGRLAETTWCGPVQQLCVMIPADALQHQARILLDNSVATPIEMQPFIDLRDPMASRWRDVLWLLKREFDRQQQGDSRAAVVWHATLASHLEALVLELLVLSQKGSRAGGPFGQSRVSTRGVRSAIDLLRSRPAEQWSTTTLAAAVHVSPRSLQEGFKRLTDQSPTAYLRTIRLEGVRACLEQARPDETTVLEAASSWGFVHMGRFALAYRERFGETPSQTLRSV